MNMTTTSCIPARKARIALLASPATRLPGGSARRFVDNNQGLLRSVHLLATGGVHMDLIAGRSDLEGTCFPDSKHDGLYFIAREIVKKRCDGVLMFPDAARSGSLFDDQNKMLLNRALCDGVETMINERTVNLWATGQTGVVDISRETIALIAHSPTSARDPKAEIVGFAREHAPELALFAGILCTGTTGKTIAEAVPTLADKIVAYRSGMEGGDVEIACDVIENKCQHVVFLINDKWAQPHRADVLAFVKACRDNDVHTLFTLNGALRWAQQLREQLAAE
jgi:methylglyoxal synthase